jgi:hypothetical protein
MTGPQQAAGEQVRTLAVAAMGTVLVLIAYTTPVATLASTERTRHGSGRPGVDPQLDELRSGRRVAAGRRYR